MNEIVEAAVIAIPVIVAITLHEAAHGFVARACGDHTASDKGRVTLNPIKHIDLFGTVLLPAFLLLTHAGFIFGWAKPVPIDPRMFRNPKRDMIWVAAAGPAMNLLLALVSALAIYIPLLFGHDVDGLWFKVFWASVTVNLVLFLLNLLPIPPLDGSKVLWGLLPSGLARGYARLNRYGMLFVLGLFVLLPMIGLDIFPWVIERPLGYVEHAILTLFRLRA